MSDAAYLKMKEAVIRDLAKGPKRVLFHEQSLDDKGLAPDYRRAVEDGLKEWKAMNQQ